MPGRGGAVTAASRLAALLLADRLPTALPPAALLLTAWIPVSAIHASTTSAARIPVKVVVKARARGKVRDRGQIKARGRGSGQKPPTALLAAATPGETGPGSGEMLHGSQIRKGSRSRLAREAAACRVVPVSKVRTEASGPLIPMPRPPRMSDRP
jgi:hypothetical protein